MPEEKMIEFIEWVGQEYAKTNLKLHCGDKTQLTLLEYTTLSTKAKVYKEVWDRILRMANNED